MEEDFDINSKISKIRKRDGRTVKFETDKIAEAISKAFVATKTPDGETTKKLAQQVVAVLEKKGFSDRKIPHVEDVQDAVEQVLIENKFAEVAKAYIIYRQRRTEIREAKRLIGVTDELKLGVNATKVLQRRYLLKDDKGNVIETPAQLFRRVAGAVAIVDKFYDPKADVQATAETFYKMMTSFEFMPNTPTLMNAGTTIGQLSACFVLPVGDSLKEILDAVKWTAVIHQTGGGTGFSFSRLRPKGDVVKSTKGIASGPVSFIRIFDTTTDVIKQGGRRRGANMGILRVDHPDIIDFVTSKSKPGALENFNISVAATDKFMEAVERDEDYELINPRNGESAGKLRAREVFDLICTMAWQTGDPGLIFIDRINRANATTKLLGPIEATNPCGEQPLHPWESCNLGSMNVSKFVKQGGKKADFDWPRLRDAIRNCVHFLDNVIDANKYPLPEIERITKANRRIGLGIMGWADALVQLGIPYDSQQAIKLAEKFMKFFHGESIKASVALAEKRGDFPNFKGSTLVKKYRHMRNVAVNTIAPTGTISIIASCSSGIEPLFAISYIRNVMEGTRLLEVNPYFEKVAREKGFYSKELMTEIAKTGSVQKIESIPADTRRIFVTALDIDPEWHVRMQAAFQKYTDNAVSKTVNLPSSATPDDIKKIYWLAYKLGCKGITIYRYGSKPQQVLYIGSEELKQKLTEAEPKLVAAESEYSGGCPTPGTCPG